LEIEMTMFQKMMLAPLMAILFATASAVSGWWVIGQQEAALEQLSKEYLDTRRIVDELRFRLATARADAYSLFSVQSNLDDAKAKIERSKVVTSLATTAKMVDDAQRRATELDYAIFKAANKSINDYSKKVERAINIAPVDINAGIAAMMSTDDQYKATIASVEVATTAVSKAAADSLDGGRQSAARSKMIMLASGAIAVLAAFILAWIICRRFSQRISAIIGALNRLANNDVSVRIPDEGKDEVSQVANVLERMRIEMLSIISNRHWASKNVSTTSSGLLHGDSGFCSRTKGRVSSSQETASLADQLGGAVLQSAENAGQASVLANSASGVAVKGRDTVNQAVGTMSETQELSKKIADIIGAIDAIALQTNSLVLNTVVEAARVGERGREGLQALPPRSADHHMSELIAAKYAAADTTVSSQIRTQQHY